MKLSVASVHSHLSSIGEEVEVFARELKKKLNLNDLSDTIEDIREKIKHNSLSIEKINGGLDEYRLESDTTTLRLSKL
jgi:hypothetical protein